MKKVLCLLFVMLMLAGCGNDDPMNRALIFRDNYQNSDGCTFLATVTADYGQTVHTFVLNCQVDTSGNVAFSVVSPESISGISGNISNEGGKLVFDEKVLAFESLAQGQINPISAPWIMMRSLAFGYITSANEEGNLYHISVNDSYKEDALHLDIWTDETNTPVYGEILWDGKRILSVKVENFVFL